MRSMRNVERVYWTQCSGKVSPDADLFSYETPKYCKNTWRSTEPMPTKWYCDDCKARMKKSGAW